MVASPCPVVDADDIEWLSRYVGSSEHDPEQRVVAHREHQPSGKARCRTSARRETEMMDDAVQPPSSSRRRRQNIAREPLYEDLLAAQYGLASEAARNDHQLDASSRQRQVADPTMVPTVHAPRSGTAGWTCRIFLRRTNRDRGLRGIVDCTHNNKTTGYQRKWPQRLMHGADSPRKSAHRRQQTSSKVSQSQFCTPNNTGTVAATRRCS